jgi:hypothetical protein
VGLYRLIALRYHTPRPERSVEPKAVAQAVQVDTARPARQESRRFIPENYDNYEGSPRGALEEVSEIPFWELSVEEERAMREQQVCTLPTNWEFSGCSWGKVIVAAGVSQPVH